MRFSGLDGSLFKAFFSRRRLLGIGNGRTRLNVKQSRGKKPLPSYLYVLRCAAKARRRRCFISLSLPLLCHHLQQQLHLQPCTDQSFPSIHLSHPLLTCSADFSVWLYSPLSRHTKEDLLKPHGLPKSTPNPSLNPLYLPYTFYSSDLPVYLLNLLFYASQPPNIMRSSNESCLWLNKKSVSICY